MRFSSCSRVASAVSILAAKNVVFLDGQWELLRRFIGSQEMETHESWTRRTSLVLEYIPLPSIWCSWYFPFNPAPAWGR